MAAILGKIDPFDPELEESSQYVERLDQFFEANDLTGDGKATKRRATFLTVVGPGPYRLLRSLLSPAKPSDKTYDELVKKLTEHYIPYDKMLRDRLVWGINDAGIQKKLLQENDPLTLARALKVAQGAETADKNL